MARYLVTGAAGFIGSVVAAGLLQQGHQVVGLDNLNDAYDPRLKTWRLDRLRQQAGFTFERADVSDRQDLERAWGSGSFDAVLNLAARAGVRPSLRDPMAYARANLIGALNVLEVCKQSGVPKVVQASTSSLYGAHNPRPFREDADISRPLSPYAASKGAAELLCHSYHHLFGLDVTILRYFTVFGPAGRPDMVIFRFVQWIHEGTPVVIYGDGAQERDFTYVQDIADGTIAALRPTGFQVINLGSDRPTPLRQVLTMLEAMIGRTADVRTQPPAPGDVRATWADIHRAGEVLGWRPLTSLEDGLAACVAWYRQERSWAKSIPTTD
ncbi:MAG: NAD-dependent epimerase/dehydratase family protein [Anaerolineales bacterium]|nr:NAD-dependent epimerase/dehydratase family protein [Anaerolineales bacterium]